MHVLCVVRVHCTIPYAMVHAWIIIKRVMFELLIAIFLEQFVETSDFN